MNNKLNHSELLLIIEQNKTILKLEQKVKELEKRLGLDSNNSSKPPSSDGLRRTSSLREKSDGVKKNGSNNKNKETLKQVENPDKIVTHSVYCCEKCNSDLSQNIGKISEKRQVFDIEKPKIIITEYQTEVKKCQCGYKNTSKFHETVKSYTQYGKNITAFAIYLSAQHFVPEDRLSQVFKDIFGIKISSKTLANFNEKSAKSIELDQNLTLLELKSAKH